MAAPGSDFLALSLPVHHTFSRFLRGSSDQGDFSTQKACMAPPACPGKPKLSAWPAFQPPFRLNCCHLHSLCSLEAVPEKYSLLLEPCLAVPPHQQPSPLGLCRPGLADLFGMLECSDNHPLNFQNHDTVPAQYSLYIPSEGFKELFPPPRNPLPVLLTTHREGFSSPDPNLVGLGQVAVELC